MKFCNIDFNILNKKQLFKQNYGETKCVIPVNAELIVIANRNKRFFNFINSNYVTFDGMVPLKVAKKLSSEFQNVEKLSGSDIVYDFAKYAKDNNLRTFYLGGHADSNASAVKKMRESYGIEIDGFSPEYEPYPFTEQFVSECRTRIELFKPDIIFVGFGAPKQEYFIEDQKEFFNSIGVKYAVSSGGTFELVSGKIARAPKWFQNLGLEFIYRVSKECSISRIRRTFYAMQFFKYIKNKSDFALP